MKFVLSTLAALIIVSAIFSGALYFISKELFPQYLAQLKEYEKSVKQDAKQDSAQVCLDSVKKKSKGCGKVVACEQLSNLYAKQCFKPASDFRTYCDSLSFRKLKQKDFSDMAKSVLSIRLWATKECSTMYLKNESIENCAKNIAKVVTTCL